MPSTLLDSVSPARFAEVLFAKSLQGIGKHCFGRPFPASVSRVHFSNPFLESALSKPCKGYVSAASHGRLWFTLFASTLSRSLLESAVWSPCRGIGQHRCANPLLPLWVALLASAFSFPLLGFASRVRFLKPAIRVRFSRPPSQGIGNHRFSS